MAFQLSKSLDLFQKTARGSKFPPCQHLREKPPTIVRLESQLKGHITTLKAQNLCMRFDIRPGRFRESIVGGGYKVVTSSSEADLLGTTLESAASSLL